MTRSQNTLFYFSVHVRLLMKMQARGACLRYDSSTQFRSTFPELPERITSKASSNSV